MAQKRKRRKGDNLGSPDDQHGYRAKSHLSRGNNFLHNGFSALRYGSCGMVLEALVNAAAENGKASAHVNAIHDLRHGVAFSDTLYKQNKAAARLETKFRKACAARNPKRSR